MKKLSFFALCAIALSVVFASCKPGNGNNPDSDDATSMIVGNCAFTYDASSALGAGTGADVEYIGASNFTADKLADNGSKKISAIRIGIPVEFTNGTVWIANDYDGDRLVEVEIEYNASGWSYAKLPTAFEIPAEKDLWIGYTITSKYGPIVYSGSKITTCKVALNNSWTDMKDLTGGRGSLCIQAITTGGDYSDEDQNDLAMLSAKAPSSVEVGKTFDFEAYVVNYGAKAASNIVVTANVAGKSVTGTAEKQTLSTGEVSKVIFSGVDAPATAWKKETIEVTASSEGVSDDKTSNDKFKSYFSTYRSGYERKMILLEQFTGSACPNCPGGARQLKAAIEGMTNPEKACWIAHHSGYKADDYTITESETIRSFVGVTGAPSIDIERTPRSVAGGFTVNFHPFYTTSVMLNEIASRETAADISIERTFNAETKELTITVTGESLEPNVKLSAMLIQSGMEGQQADVVNGQGQYVDYTHNNAPRHFFTAALGDAVTLDADKKFTATYAYTIPETVGTIATVIDNMEVVAYVAVAGTSVENSPVLNTVRIPVLESAPYQVYTFNYSNNTVPCAVAASCSL